jgi:hypothetical protein
MTPDVDYASVLIKAEQAFTEVYPAMLEKDPQKARLYAAEVIRCMAHFIAWTEKP